MTGSFAGKVACITGAASGIGRATALLLAREGAAIVAAATAIAPKRSRRKSGRPAAAPASCRMTWPMKPRGSR